MKLIQTLKNIWKIEELRNRLLTTLGFIAVYRFCSFVVLPGINTEALTALHGQTREGIMSLLDMFSGGAFSNASIVALGIMPYISASIVMQLLGMAVPFFQKLQREGESGRRKINQYTRYMTLLVLVLQAPAYLANLSAQMGYSGASLPPGWWFSISSVLILTAGSGQYQHGRDAKPPTGGKRCARITHLSTQVGKVGRSLQNQYEKCHITGILIDLTSSAFTFTLQFLEKWHGHT